MSKSQKKKMCVNNGNENANCPNCGRRMETVEYYTARPLRQEQIRRDYNSKTILTTYTDVNPHMGNICLFCAHENQKKKRVAGLVVFIGSAAASSIAMLAGLVLSTIAQNNGKDVGAALGLPMALMCIFLIIAIVGLAFFLGSRAYDPRRSRSRDQLYLLFIECLSREILQVGYVFLTPQQVAQMRKK